MIQRMIRAATLLRTAGGLVGLTFLLIMLAPLNLIGQQAVWRYLITSPGGQEQPVGGGIVAIDSPEVGKASQLKFRAMNISGGERRFSIADLSTPFFIVQRPSSDLIVPHEGSVEFTIEFLPRTIQSFSQTLRVNLDAFTLASAGRFPSGSLSIVIRGSTDPRQQARASVVSSQKPAVEIAGTLEVRTAPDPVTQMGRLRNDFKIPAEADTALFGADRQPELGILIGTAAGSIELVVSNLKIADGAPTVNLNPDSPPARPINVPMLAPVVGNIGFKDGGNLVLRGYTTTRTIDRVSITANPKPGAKVKQSVTSLPDIRQEFERYFANEGRLAGGQFELIVPISIEGDRSLIESLSVSIANEINPPTTTSVTLP